MRHRAIQLTGTIGVALLLCLVFFAIFAGLTAWSATPASAQELVSEGTEGYANPVIVDRRLISIPFGVASPLVLQPDGQIYAKGEVTCDDDMISFKIRSRVTQADIGAIGKSNFVSFPCDAEDNSEWVVTAEPQGPTAFEAGYPADLCVMVLFYRSKGPVDVFDWCYLDVPVESP